MNREQWLNDLATELAPKFEAYGSPLPTSLRLACGFPSKGGRAKVIGECHYPENSDGQYTEIFIRPDRCEPLEVGAIVLHELCHAALGPGFGHGKEFKKIATAKGLVGKMRSTEAGPQAIELLTPIIEKIGPYPHHRLNLSFQPRAQASHPHRNLNCPECGFHAKVLLNQMDWGRLTCPVDGAMLLMKGEEA